MGTPPAQKLLESSLYGYTTCSKAAGSSLYGYTTCSKAAGKQSVWVHHLLKSCWKQSVWVHHLLKSCWKAVCMGTPPAQKLLESSMYGYTNMFLHRFYNGRHLFCLPIALLDDKLLPEKGLLLRERICF